MAEYYDDVSPYNYALNNPINNTDPDGRAVQGLLNDYVFDKEGNLKTVILNDKPDRFFQLNDAGSLNEIGADKMTIGMTGQYLAESAKYAKDGGTLNEVEIRGKKFQPIMPALPTSLIGRVVLEKGLEMSFPLEKLLPGTRLIASAANIIAETMRLANNAKPNNAQDKPLSKGEIERLEKNGHDVHELKGGKRTGKIDLYKKPNGDVVIKPKGGKGPGEPTGVNLNNLK